MQLSVGLFKAFISFLEGSRGLGESMRDFEGDFEWDFEGDFSSQLTESIIFHVCFIILPHLGFMKCSLKEDFNIQ